MHSLQNIVHINFPVKQGREASLFVYEQGEHIRFGIQRLFVVKAADACSRGNHAHIACTQLLICLNGRCNVTCDDGLERKGFVLDSPEMGLLIPPTIWAEQEYAKDSILMVLTDQPYDESDYLRNYEDFLEFRGLV